MKEFMELLAHSLALILFFLAHLAGLLVIPFGLPGTMLQVLAAALLCIVSDGARISWIWVVLFLLIALFGELVDFLSGQWGTKRFGGSGAAGWGALLGGIGGALVGLPIPVVGSVVASFLGTFGGALLGQMYTQRKLEPDLRVGFGALLGRAIGVGFKLFLAFVILVMSIVAVIH